MNQEKIAFRFDNRAGYRLVTYGTVGLPVYRLVTIGLCLARKSLSPIEEFVLRVVASGVDTMAEVAGLLGLDSSVIESCLSELVRTECVRVSLESSEPRRIALTGKGEKVAREQEAVFPMEQTIAFCVDGLTRKPRFYPNESLYKPRELKDQGIPEVRAFPSRPPTLEEININDVIEVVKLDTGPIDSPRQLLRINSIERRDRLFLEAVVLAYRAETGGSLQIAFVIDGRLSMEHEQAFARAGGLENTKLFRGLLEHVSTPPMDDLLGTDISHQVSQAIHEQGRDAEQLSRDARAVRARIDTARLDAAQTNPGEFINMDVATKDKHAELVSVEKQFSELCVRPLAVYEHPPLLQRAFDEAEQHVLVISPWIRRAVVDDDFMERLRKALGRGVKVYIGYGLGEGEESEKSWDKDARQELEKLAIESDRFVLRRLGNTHAKVLIKDTDFFIISSFNWLSFKGNPNRTFREEWGTLVSLPSAVNGYFKKMVERFM